MKQYTFDNLTRKPATLYDKSNPDWAPAQKMGHDKLAIKESDFLRHERVSQQEDKERESLEADSLRNIDKIAHIQDAKEIDDSIECKWQYI